MNLIVAPAEPCLIADTYESLTSAGRDALIAKGYRAFGRYAENLTRAELEMLLLPEGATCVLLLGTSRAPGWSPDAGTGAADAARLLARLAALGIPAGASLVDDCETPNALATTEDRIAHVDAFAGPVAAAGFLPSAYLGEGYGLTSDEWQARPNVHRYGKSASRLRDHLGAVVEPDRGFSWVQGSPVDLRVGPCTIDPGLLLHDYRGDAMMVVRAA